MLSSISFIPSFWISYFSNFSRLGTKVQETSLLFIYLFIVSMGFIELASRLYIVKTSTLGRDYPWIGRGGSGKAAPETRRKGI